MPVPESSAFGGQMLLVGVSDLGKRAHAAALSQLARVRAHVCQLEGAL